MSDLFHESMPREFLNRIFEVIEKHTGIYIKFLTKRDELMLDYLLQKVPLKMFGSVLLSENSNVKNRIDSLRQIDSTIRIHILEPLIDSIARLT